MRLVAILAALVTILQVQQVAPASFQRQVDLYGEPLIVLNAEKAWLGADAFWPLAKSGDPIVQRYALRAIGRLEDPANVRALLAIGQAPRGPARVAAEAIVQSLYQFAPARDPELIAVVSAWFLSIASPDLPTGIPPTPGPLGNVTYQTEEQFHSAERRLIKILEKREDEPKAVGFYTDAAMALESLVRVNPRFPQLDDRTLERLPTMVAGRHVNDPGRPALAAMRILMPRGLDADTERKALNSPSLVQLATQMLAGNGSGLDADERLAAIQERLKDPLGVTYEALRAYITVGLKTLGCQPLVDAINDKNPAVMLEAIDTLGNACKEDEEITKRIADEVRVPPRPYAAGSGDPSVCHACEAFAGRAEIY